MSRINEPEDRTPRQADPQRSSSASSSAARNLLIADLRHAVYSAVPERDENELRAAAWRTRERAERLAPAHDDHREAAKTTPSPSRWASRVATAALVLGTVAPFFEWFLRGTVYSSTLLVVALIAKVYLAERSNVVPIAQDMSWPTSQDGHSLAPAEDHTQLVSMGELHRRDDTVSQWRSRCTMMVAAGSAALALAAASVLVSVSIGEVAATPQPRPIVEWTTPPDGSQLPQRYPTSPQESAPWLESAGPLSEVMTTRGGATLYVATAAYENTEFSAVDATRAAQITGASLESPLDSWKWKQAWMGGTTLIIPGAIAVAPRKTAVVLTRLSRSNDSNVWEAQFSYSRPLARTEPCGASVTIDPSGGRVIRVAPVAPTGRSAVFTSAEGQDQACT